MKHAIATTALAAVLGLYGAAAARAGVADGAVNADLANSGSAALQQVQFFFGGNNYCWYDQGWHGPGYYWCGYAWNNGLGWGGGPDFNGWGWGGRGYHRWSHDHGHDHTFNHTGGSTGPHTLNRPMMGNHTMGSMGNHSMGNHSMGNHSMGSMGGHGGNGPKP